MRTSSLVAAALVAFGLSLAPAKAGEVAEVRLDAQGQALPLNPSVGPDASSAESLAQIIIIRHAEKPDSGNDLSPRGEQRAQALVGFFQTNPAVTQYGTPVAIYAMRPKADGKDSRPLETVQPLAQSLGLAVNTDYRKEDVGGLARAILSEPSYSGRMVLIAWEHHVIPSILKAFGWTQGPASWPGDAYDRAWILNFDGGKPVSFQDVPQHLLPGDGSN